MTNYHEGSGSTPEEGSGGSGGQPGSYAPGSGYQEGAGYQSGPIYQGGPGYQGGQGYEGQGYEGYQGQGQGYQGATQETSQFHSGAHQTWQGGPGYSGQGQQDRYGRFPGGGSGGGQRRLNVRSTFKTTEFWVYVVAALAILIAAAVTDEGADGQGFGASQAWKYVTWLTIGYLISRGLTKFGGHERDRDRGGDKDRD